MAKRIYTPKTVSPEIARENAISIAKSRVMNASKDLADVQGTIAQWTRRGIAEVDGLTMADLERRATRASAELALRKVELAAIV